MYGGFSQILKQMETFGWSRMEMDIMEEKFEYSKAIEELEAMAAKVEDPQTGIGDIDKYMKRSQELIEACRAYLRGAREKLEA